MDDRKLIVHYQNKITLAKSRTSGDDVKRVSAAAKAKKLSVSEWIRSTLEANLNA